MKITNLDAVWELTEVAAANTPLGLGWSEGEQACIARVWNTEIAFNKTQLRLLTREQRKYHFPTASPIRDQTRPRKMVSELVDKLMSSRTGMLIPYAKVETFPLPSGWPTTYLDRRILCSRRFPAVPAPQGWTWADWLGLTEIYVEQAIAEAITAKKRWDMRDDTLQHEYHESGDSYMCAKMMFPGATEEQLIGLMLIFGGWSHLRTIHVVDGFGDGLQDSEAAYDKDFDAQLAELGLPKEKPHDR